MQSDEIYEDVASPSYHVDLSLLALGLVQLDAAKPLHSMSASFIFSSKLLQEPCYLHEFWQTVKWSAFMLALVPLILSLNKCVSSHFIL